MVVLGCTCETVRSTDVKTSGLYADFDLDAPGEALSATWGATSRAMQKRSAFGATWYEASFDGDAEDTALTIRFMREAEVSAPESVVTLPPPFELTAPALGQSFPRGAPVTVSYTRAASDELKVSARGSCIETVERVLTGDTGAYTLPAFTASRGNESASCDVQVAVVRARKGRVDPAYGLGGDFTATVSRAVTIRSTP